REYAYELQQPAHPEDFSPCNEPFGCNTRIEYLYRDANNFKQYEVIVVAGVLDEYEQCELRNSLTGDRFVPEQVGMQPLRAGLLATGPGDDRAWHEIESISTTEEPT